MGTPDHGSPVNVGEVVQVCFRCQTRYRTTDYDQIRELALQHRPKLLICGYSAYPRVIDFEKFRRIADEIVPTC